MKFKESKEAELARDALLIVLKGLPEIESQADYEKAVLGLLGIAKYKQDVDDTFGETVCAAHKAHKKALADRKEYELEVLGQEDVLRSRVSSYTPRVPSPHISFAESWDVVIDDENKIPREFMVPDLKRLKSIVRSQKGAIMVPGVSASSKKSLRLTLSSKEKEQVET